MANSFGDFEGVNFRRTGEGVREVLVKERRMVREPSE